MALTNHKTQRGITLAETIVYAAVLAFFCDSRSWLARALSDVQVAYGISKADTFLNVPHGTNDLRNSAGQRVDLSNSILNTSPGKLVLNTTLADGTPTTVEFSVSTSTLVMKQGGASLGSLTSASTTIDSVIFKLLTNGSVSKAVRVETQISATSGGYSKTAKLYNTIILRGSY